MDTLFYYRNYIIGALTIIALVLGLIKVVIQVEYSTHGGNLFALQEQLSELKRENQIMEMKILELTSLRHIEEEAKKMGFREARPEDYIYIYD